MVHSRLTPLYKLDSYETELKSARSMKKVEGNMGFEETSLPDKHDCALADLSPPAHQDGGTPGRAGGADI